LPCWLLNLTVFLLPWSRRIVLLLWWSGWLSLRLYLVPCILMILPGIPDLIGVLLLHLHIIRSLFGDIIILSLNILIRLFII
jgi:hypothetical protein